jgi:spore maturation protein CgeB
MSATNGMIHHDCMDGFKALGWQPSVESFGIGVNNESDTHEKLALRIRSLDPNLVLSINHVGCDLEGYIPAALKRAGIPLVIWYVDNPFALLPEEDKEIVKDATLLLCSDSSYVDKIEQQRGVSAAHLPLGTNPKRFYPPLSSHFPPEWDISFVGNLNLDMVTHQRSSLKRDNPPLNLLVERAVKELQTGSSESIDDMLKILSESLGIAWDLLPHALRERVRIVAETEASAQRRISIVRELSGFGIKVVGSREWDQYILSEQLLPPVDYLNGLCNVYQNSRINLNISSFQLRAGVNQRIFDVPATSGFLLTDRTPELEYYLQANEEVGVFEDMHEAEAKARYYLSHEKERATIGEKARRRVLHEHTYYHRMTKILEMIGQK